MNETHIYIAAFIFSILMFIVVYYFYNLYISRKKNITSILRTTKLSDTVNIPLSGNVADISFATSSMSIWINIHSISPTTNEDKLYIYKFGNTNGDFVYGLYIDQLTGEIYFQTDSTSSKFLVTKHMNPNVWNHIVVNIFNNKTFEFYINAKLVNTYISNSNNIQDIASKADSCYLFSPNQSRPPVCDVSIQQFQRNLYTLPPSDVLNLYKSGTTMNMPSYNFGYEYTQDGNVINSGLIF